MGRLDEQAEDEQEAGVVDMAAVVEGEAEVDERGEEGRGGKRKQGRHMGHGLSEGSLRRHHRGRVEAQS